MVRPWRHRSCVVLWPGKRLPEITFLLEGTRVALPVGADSLRGAGWSVLCHGASGVRGPWPPRCPIRRAGEKQAVPRGRPSLRSAQGACQLLDGAGGRVLRAAASAYTPRSRPRTQAPGRGRRVSGGTSGCGGCRDVAAAREPLPLTAQGRGGDTGRGSQGPEPRMAPQRGSSTPLRAGGAGAAIPGMTCQQMQAVRATIRARDGLLAPRPCSRKNGTAPALPVVHHHEEGAPGGAGHCSCGGINRRATQSGGPCAAGGAPGARAHSAAGAPRSLVLGEAASAFWPVIPDDVSFHYKPIVVFLSFF